MGVDGQLNEEVETLKIRMERKLRRQRMHLESAQVTNSQSKRIFSPQDFELMTVPLLQTTRMCLESRKSFSESRGLSFANARKWISLCRRGRNKKKRQPHEK